MTAARDITRALWNVLRPQGDPVDCIVTVRQTGVDIEDADGHIQIAVYPQEDGIDIRVHDVQLCVKKQHVTLLQQHPPYPINRWTILWEGELDWAPAVARAGRTGDLL